MSTRNEPIPKIFSNRETFLLVLLGLTAVAGYLGAALLFLLWTLAIGFAPAVPWHLLPWVLCPLLYGIFANVATVRFGRSREGKHLILTCVIVSTSVFFALGFWLYLPAAIPGVLILLSTVAAFHG
jgi:hypothetical protein